LTEFLLGLIWAEIGVYEFYILGGTIEKWSLKRTKFENGGQIWIWSPTGQTT
jgi:hypothetical protein